MILKDVEVLKIIESQSYETDLTSLEHIVRIPLALTTPTLPVANAPDLGASPNMMGGSTMFTKQQQGKLHIHVCMCISFNMRDPVKCFCICIYAILVCVFYFKNNF